MAIKKQPEPQQDAAVHQPISASADLIGDGDGEALLELSQNEIGASPIPTAPEPPAALGPTAEPSPPPEAVEAFTVRVLCATTLGADRYQPNDVIEGVPADVLAQYADSLDPHPDAVAFAKAEGGSTHQFEA